jgi:hypothetical protein
MKTIKRKDFIQLYILPNETKEIILQYYNGVTDFDDEYLKEVATGRGIIIKDIN